MNEAFATLQIIDEVVEKEGFTIDNDNAAEWALTKLSEEKAELQRMINICNTKIAEYQFKIQQLQEKHDNKTMHLRIQLNEFFNSLPDKSKKSSKTQTTYSLPSGKLKLKKQAPEFLRDEEKLIKWCKDVGATEFIKTKESLDWASMKNGLDWTNDGYAVDGDGQIVDGIKVVERPDKFEIEI